MGLLDFAQAASNAAASTVTGPVDLLSMILQKMGINVGTAPVGGTEWAKRQGLMRDVEQGPAQVAGETAGLLSPVAIPAKAAQVARGLLKMGENAAAPGLLNAGARGQRGAVPYWTEHRPMTVDGGASTLNDLTKAFGQDIYGPNALQFFGSGDAREKAALGILKSVRGKPNEMVTIYRGVPNEAAAINAGDWIALDPRVAADYASQLGGKVISMKVPASHVTSWADSLLEFGYYPPGVK